jgi:hypothetical protein
VAVRFTAFCKSSAAGISPADLLTGITAGDLMTAAEGDEVPDALIESALDQLRIERVEGEGFFFYRLSYRPDGHRQVDIHRWAPIEEARDVAAEVLDDLEASGDPLLPVLRPHLDATIDVVDASFGSSPDEAMALTLASEVARWIAEKYAGIIQAPDDTWWELGSHGEYVRIRA